MGEEAEGTAAPRPTVAFTYPLPTGGADPITLQAVDDADHIVRTIRQTGTFYERDLLAYLLAMRGREPRSTIIDVGANIGNHAVFFARYLASHLIAVEPNPDLLPVLHRNLEANAVHPSTWTIVRAAAGAREGTALLERGSAAGSNIGMARVREVESPANPAALSVRVTTIDRLVEDHERQAGPVSRVGLIKIDVEGMEPAVLEGCRGVLERFGPDLIVEAQGAAEKDRIEEIVRPYGYVAISRHCATPTYHYVRRPSWRLLLKAKGYQVRRWAGRHLRAFLARRIPGAGSGSS